MKLEKLNQQKELHSEKAIARWKRFGWTEVGQTEVVENTETQPKKRGRPAKKED